MPVPSRAVTDQERIIPVSSHTSPYNPEFGIP
jgi:hypothetical protein